MSTEHDHQQDSIEAGTDTTLPDTLNASVVGECGGASLPADLEDGSASLPAGPVVDVTPHSDFKAPNSKHRALLPTTRKCRIISVLVVIILTVGLIVAVVLLAKIGAKSSTGTSEVPSDTIENQYVRDIFLAELKLLLTNKSLAALDNPESPQSLALEWLLERSNFEAWPFDRQVQRYAMATIFYATDGPNWSNGDGSWLTNESECRWYQVWGEEYCNGNDELSYLYQQDNALHGTIPDEIRLLSSLTAIVLTWNQMSGTVPSELGSLTALTYLNLGRNHFTGTVPSELGSLTALESLSLKVNSFQGTVPSELGSLTQLTHLELDYNSFTGTLPSELGSLTALKSLSLWRNAITGTLPSELGSLTVLSWAYLADTSLSGTFPEKLCHNGFSRHFEVNCELSLTCSCCVGGCL